METKFNFNSQACTSKAQSERLLALGLKKETADMAHNKNTIIPKYKVVPVSHWDLLSELEETTYIPAWSLHRLLCIVKECWNVKESLIIDTDNIYPSAIKRIEWLIKEGYFNKEYLV